jgi:hypothetical protein
MVNPKDPIGRDMAAYRFMAVCSLLLIGTIVFMGGLFLKQERKVTVGMSNGCYQWSDGHVQCDGRKP